MAPSQEAQDQPSLCTRLGGVYSIATAVDDFIDGVMSDPAQRQSAGRRGPSSRPPAGFKYLVTEMLCCAAGGPQSQNRPGDGGVPSPFSDHRREWQAFLDDLQQMLDKFAVPAAEPAEIKALVDSMRSASVVG